VSGKALAAGFSGHKRTGGLFIERSLAQRQLCELERQNWDAVKIASVQNVELDLPYLEKWAADRQLDDRLDKLLAEAGIRQPDRHLRSQLRSHVQKHA